MQWLSVLALCAALFIAATHASQLQDEGMMDRAAEEKLLQLYFLTIKQRLNFLNEIKLADEEIAVYKGMINTAGDKARSQRLLS